MNGVVLGASVGLEISAVVTLHTQHGLNSQYGVKVGILAARFLTAPPTGIAEYVYVGAPERKLWIPRIVDHAHWHVEDVVVRAVPVSAGLVAHLRKHVEHQLGVECSGHADGLRIYRVSILSHSMTSLAPPVVARNAQTVY